MTKTFTEHAEARNQLARGEWLREFLTQAQSAPLSVEEQVVTIYIQIFGYIRGWTSLKVLGSVSEYITSNKPQFGEIVCSIKTFKIVCSTMTFTEEAETISKDAIIESIELCLLQEKQLAICFCVTGWRAWRFLALQPLSPYMHGYTYNEGNYIQ